MLTMLTNNKAIEILNALAWVQGGPDREETIAAISMAIEALDAVEVVRCKDCKHRRNICPMRYIETVGEDERIHDYSTDNGYCSWGERREDGEV